MSQISVIVPVYKVEPYLRRCIVSILSQTFTDFDLILIDDGSPDQCGLICDAYCEQESRIHVIHHRVNLGLSAARNSGIDWAMEYSNSKWITFVDSDDWVSPIYLKALYEAAQGYDISIGSMINCRGETPPVPNIGTFYLRNTEDYFCDYYANAVVTWGKLYKKSLFEKLRFPVGKVYEDTFMTHKLLFQYPVLPVTTQPVYYYFFNSEGITHCAWNPSRLDELQATTEQISYFIKHHFLNIAKARFDYFRKVSERSVNEINKCRSLSDRQKKKHIRFVRRMQRKTLLMCCRYKWCSIWNRGEDLWFYSNAFVSVHLVHMLWRKLKGLLP